MLSVYFLLDDFLAITRPSEDGNRTMALLTMVFNRLRLPIHPRKTLGPVTALEYLGVRLDSVAMTAYLPADKLARIIAMIDGFRHRRRITKRELLSLLGHINFASRVIRPGRSFISYLLKLVSHWHANFSRLFCEFCRGTFARHSCECRASVVRIFCVAN